MWQLVRGTSRPPSRTLVRCWRDSCRWLITRVSLSSPRSPLHCREPRGCAVTGHFKDSTTDEVSPPLPAPTYIAGQFLFQKESQRKCGMRGACAWTGRGTGH